MDGGSRIFAAGASAQQCASRRSQEGGRPGRARHWPGSNTDHRSAISDQLGSCDPTCLPAAFSSDAVMSRYSRVREAQGEMRRNDREDLSIKEQSEHGEM